MIDPREYTPVIYLRFGKTWSVVNTCAVIAGISMYVFMLACYMCVAVCGDFLDKPLDPDEVDGKKEGEDQAGNNGDGNVVGDQNNQADRPVAVNAAAAAVVQGNNNNDNPGGGANAVPGPAPAHVHR